MPSSDQIASDSSPKLVADPRAERQRPRRVDAAAERRQHAQPPVADLVAEALDDDRAVARDHARGRLLLAQVVEQVAAPRARRGRSRARASRRAGRPPSAQNAPIATPSSFGRPTESPRQNGTAPGTPGAGVTIDAVAADLLDAPGRGAEQERLARPRLVDHLLVELADAAAVGQRHREQAAVGDRAGVRDRELARALAGADRARPRGPRRSAGAARRTRPRGSGRRACRARSRAARATARRRSACG